MNNNLLAKGWDCKLSESAPEWAMLVPHLKATGFAAETIIEASGRQVLDSLALDGEEWFTMLKRALRVAGLLHDIGKANEAFQKMVRGRLSPAQQPIRHELVTLLMLDEIKPIQEWAISQLETNESIAKTLLIAIKGAVVGHHVKMDESWKKAALALSIGGCGATVDVFIGHRDLQSLFGNLGLPERWSLNLVDGRPDSLTNRLIRFKSESMQWQKFLNANPEWHRFYAALKALLVAADVAASAILPEGIDMQRWIMDALKSRSEGKDFQNVSLERLGSALPRPFQRAVGESESRVTLVEAGCGTGKTIAAYLWAEKHSVGKKLFFSYPTTGTATEGFLGYVAESQIEGELIHSRATVDLERVGYAPDEDAGESLLKIASLKSWEPKVVVCTADTVLALLRNNRKGLYSSPAILSAAFVFDELHAYDERMFASVIALIKELPGASFLLMSASLPDARKRLLMDHVGDIRQIPTPLEFEEIKRYRFARTKADEALLLAADFVKRGKKVLWIVNTVSRAQALYERAADSGIKAITYHSRFKYIDRVEKHRGMIDEFYRANGMGLLAVTTQVAEMSLDIDADLLISEIAPVPALIQRLGRLNRRVTPEHHGEPRQALFILPEKEAPYSLGDLDLAERWLDSLIALEEPLSQKELSEAFKASYSPAGDTLDTRMEWLDSGLFAAPGPVREPGFSVQVLMEGDSTLWKNDRRGATKYSIPINFDKSRDMDSWPIFKGCLIAPPGSLNYNAQKGASWH